MLQKQNSCCNAAKYHNFTIDFSEIIVGILLTSGLIIIYYIWSFSYFLQVILVGHDFGGTCISYAMEAFPSKIAKAVFVSAAMLMSGQSTLDMFTMQVATHFNH